MTLALSFTLAWRGSGAVLLDDDWDDGDRTDTNLPEESAWYANVAAGIPTLSASVGALSGNVLVVTPDATNTTSRLWITHFTAAGSPVELGLKDTLKITLAFTPSNVVARSATDRGFRIGLFNFSEPGAARVTGDGFSTGSGAGAPGANVTGYMLNMNFGQTFGTTPLQIMKRSIITNTSLMGTTGNGVYTTLPGSGTGMTDSPGFSNGVTYTFEFTVRRNSGSVELTTTFSDTNGWSITHTATDAMEPTFRFDGFAIRPNSVADSAESFLFTRFKAELIPFIPRITAIQISAFDAQVTWETLPNRMYRLDARNGLDASTPWMPLHSVTALGDFESYTDLDALSREQRFYRVEQLAPP